MSVLSPRKSIGGMAFSAYLAFSRGVYEIAVSIVELSVEFRPIHFCVTKFCFSFRSPLACSLPRVCNIVSPDVEGDGCVVREVEGRDGSPVTDDNVTHMDG